jgi:transposase
MLIIGCDFHPKFQQIAYVDQESGEYGERRLNHPEEATQFYRSLAGSKVRIGLEATGNFRWFRRLLGELGHETLLGDPGAIHASIRRRQQTDKRDARHLLTLLVEDRFPVVWQPPVANEETRQLLLHRCRLVRLREPKRPPAHGSMYSGDRPRYRRKDPGTKRLSALTRAAVMFIPRRFSSQAQ